MTARSSAGLPTNAQAWKWFLIWAWARDVASDMAGA
jgi:hypothetical protein